MSGYQRNIAIILLVIAGVIFLVSVGRVAILVARANVGLYEALIIAALALVLLVTSRRR